MSALAPVMMAISSHGTAIGVDPAAWAKAIHSPPSTRPEMAAEAATASWAAAELADDVALVDAVLRAPVHRLLEVERDRQFPLGLVGHLPKSGPAQNVNDVIPGDFHLADCRV
jgi:hypothetical protein